MQKDSNNKQKDSECETSDFWSSTDLKLKYSIKYFALNIPEAVRPI